MPDQPFEYGFVDKSLDQLYRKEALMGRLISIFTGLALFIACVGLFGLASYTVKQRTKEIGTRKAIGASVQNIIGLLSGESPNSSSGRTSSPASTTSPTALTRPSGSSSPAVYPPSSSHDHRRLPRRPIRDNESRDALRQE